MKQTLSTACAVLVCLLVAGCAHSSRQRLDGPGGDRTLSRYMPLTIGNRWTYATSFQGQAQPDLTVEIVGQEGGFFLDNRPSPSRYRFDAEGLRDGTKRYMLKTPLAEGTEWMSVADLNTVEHYRIVDVDRRVQVPAGVFSGCVVVRMEVRMNEKQALRNEMTFAPDVGIIEVRTLLQDGSKFLPQSHLQLKVLELAKPKA
jgi:hypothetical protein